jgi:hypothetical protein
MSASTGTRTAGTSAPRRTRRKVTDHRQVTELEQIPNVGPSIAGDLRLLGIRTPRALIGRSPYKLYDALCKATNARQDPCVYDVFIAAVRFMEGAPVHPWWHYTAERKRTLGER